MKRRDVLKGILGVTGMAMVTPTVVRAEDGTFLVDITSNHGHALKLDSDTVMELLREVREQGSVIVDITGASRHSHSIEMVEADVLAIIDGELAIESSTDFGHSHIVTITKEA